MSGLRDKVVVITGASSGIGAATAVEFAKHGCKLVLAARRTYKLHETATKCGQTGNKHEVVVVTADITQDDHLQRIVQQAVDTFGGIDILINNAGVAVNKNTFDTTVEDMDRMYRMHTRSVFVLTKLCLPFIIPRKGNIVNVSSISAVVPISYVMPYAVAKAAQDHMMKAMSLDLGPKGVRINSICPGSILTEIFSTSGYTGVRSLSEVLEDQASVHPLKRMGTPEEAANAIVFLASDKASFISGVALSVDAGRANSTLLPKSRL